MIIALSRTYFSSLYTSANSEYANVFVVSFQYSTYVGFIYFM